MTSSAPRSTPLADAPATPADRVSAASAAAVEIAGLAKRFGARVVLSDLELTLRSGEFVSILGASGCGKTTLLRILAGLERQSAGAVRFPAGGDGAAPPATRVMFQEDRLLPWRRVLDNVALGLPPGERERARAMLARVGLSDHALDWPHTLSGGQRQRVALARALVHRPSLLLLDEPFGALDALTRADMQQLLETLWLERRVTVLLVTHDIEEALRLSDRVLVLSGGRVAHETPVMLPRPRRGAGGALARAREALEDVIRGRRVRRATAPLESLDDA